MSGGGLNINTQYYLSGVAIMDYHVTTEY